ncbi:MAG TPA: 2-amino-4-hydroxy-6-hydroxymethyldihydropteridine diphosphokinase [bacterium]|nr:2-amino-4-hydroxy-6-hydroxymethyldihydropteridine diphosphokinase [bacterium]HPG44188.1 2-amino-4-hydroxy-6-hydroxymethyldihydropteridine diphosphokinase [bacterium]HPM96555.1 2-amino-4-hydroxy-6-hydroxymethyldihydropteridine diphosphokinase [bacterium]
MSLYALGLGSNLGERIQTLVHAVIELDQVSQTEVQSVSSLYETEPVGLLPQPNYINGAVLILSDLQPEELLREIQAIEIRFGRIRTRRRWGPRTLDIDILLIESMSIHTKRLTVPHPQLFFRRFALLPLAELVPDWVIPGSGTTVTTALADCPESGIIQCVLTQHQFLQRVREVQ